MQTMAEEWAANVGAGSGADTLAAMASQVGGPRRVRVNARDRVRRQKIAKTLVPAREEEVGWQAGAKVTDTYMGIPVNAVSVASRRATRAERRVAKDDPRGVYGQRDMQGAGYYGG